MTGNSLIKSASKSADSLKQTGAIDFFVTRESPLVLTLFAKSAVFVAGDVLSSPEDLSRDGEISYLSLKLPRFRLVLKLIQSAGSKAVRVFSVRENCTGAKLVASSGEDAKRSIAEFIEDQATFENSFGRVMALELDQALNGEISVRMALVDSDSLLLKFASFEDTFSFANLEAVLLSERPKEILLKPPKLTAEAYAKVCDIAKYCDSVLSLHRESHFSADFALKSLQKLLAAPFDENECGGCLQPISAALKYFDDVAFILSDTQNEGKWRAQRIRLKNVFLMNACAVKTLNLFPPKKQRISDGKSDHRFSSLRGLLGLTKTPMGARRLDQMIRQPLLKIDKIERRLDIVELFLENGAERRAVREVLAKTVHVHRLLYRLRAGLSGCQDLAELYSFSNDIRSLFRLVSGLKNKAGAQALSELILAPLSAAAGNLALFEAMVEKAVDFSAAEVHRFGIKKDLSPEIQKAFERAEELSEKLENVRRKLNVAGAGGKAKIESDRFLGRHLSATKTNFAKLGAKKSCRILKMQKTAVKFTTPKFSRFSDALNSAESEKERLCAAAAKELAKAAASFERVFFGAAEAVALLDVFAAFAQTAFEAAAEKKPYCRPAFRRCAALAMTAARHPLLERLGGPFRANDLAMAAGQSHFVVVTGPNMGGKSTFLRQTALVAIMAQIGCFVPCASADLTPLRAVLVRAGAEDAPARGVSTFLAEMREAAAILSAADERSLVLVDELGRGTSTADGFGLSRAIAEALARRRCFALFATHFHGLAALERECPGASNLHVAAELRGGRLELPHAVRRGSSPRSYGLQVARLVGFPAEVVAAARRKMAELGEEL